MSTTTVYIVYKTDNVQQDFYLTDKAEAERVVAAATQREEAMDELRQRLDAVLQRYPNTAQYAFAETQTLLRLANKGERGECLHMLTPTTDIYLRVIHEKDNFERDFAALGLTTEQLEYLLRNRRKLDYHLREGEVEDFRPGEPIVGFAAYDHDRKAYRRLLGDSRKAHAELQEHNDNFHALRNGDHSLRQSEAHLVSTLTQMARVLGLSYDAKQLKEALQATYNALPGDFAKKLKKKATLPPLPEQYHEVYINPLKDPNF